MHGLAHAGEGAALAGFVDQALAFLCDARIGIPDRDGRRDEGLAHQIGAEFLHGLLHQTSAPPPNWKRSRSWTPRRLC